MIVVLVFKGLLNGGQGKNDYRTLHRRMAEGPEMGRMVKSDFVQTGSPVPRTSPTGEKHFLLLGFLAHTA